MSDTARDQAEAQMSSIREMVGALECDFDRLEELREERAPLQTAVNDLLGAGAPLEYNDAVRELVEWDADNAEELAGLEAEAGDCEDREAAETRIQEDALSVEVRSDWHAVGDDSDSSAFRIVVCTGGPHVQIRGELYGSEPSCAWLEYQDWGAPVTERVNSQGDMDTLLTYARCFFFGE